MLQPMNVSEQLGDTMLKENSCKTLTDMYKE